MNSHCTVITDRAPTKDDADRNGCVLAMRRWHDGYHWEVMNWQGAALLSLPWMRLPPFPGQEAAS